MMETNINIDLQDQPETSNIEGYSHFKNISSFSVLLKDQFASP